MIKHISTSDRWIISTWQSNSTINHPAAGTVKYNSNSQGLEVWDGYSWVSMEHSANIKMTTEADRILLWAEGKMLKEEHAKKIAKDYPIVQDALDKIKAGEEELQIALALVTPNVS